MENSIIKTDLMNLVEPHFHEELENESYEVDVRGPCGLLTWNRLDIAFKLIYLEYRNVCERFAKDVYDEHIHALTLGKNIEPGNPKKNSKERFISEFDRVYEDILTKGFDVSQSIIPLASDGSIVNGAHRLASAIHANKPVACVNVEATPHIYDYQFFYSRRVSKSSIELAVSKFIETANNVYIALIWPSATGYDQDVAELIPSVVYKKEVKLNSNGAKNLLIQVYHSEMWLGNVGNKFSGVDGKFVECFKNFNSLRVIAFQADSFDNVLLIKQNIRDLFNIGKHSIHITDTKLEAIRVSRLVFNENSVHFLNYAEPHRYLSTHFELGRFKKFIKSNNLDKKEILIDGSLLLSLYGLRESKDVDYLSMNVLANAKFDVDININNHDEDLKFHQEDKSMLICNPFFHFYHDDLKFISFQQLYRMKKNRGEEKDLNDLAMMDSLLNNDSFASCMASLRQNLYYARVKSKSKAVVWLKRIRLYELARAIYREIFK